MHVPDPLSSVTLQLAPVTSFTETVPVGTPVPATVAATVADTVTGRPKSAGFGEAVTVTAVFSVNVTLRVCDALCAGGPGSETETVKLYVPGVPLCAPTRETTPEDALMVRNEGRPVAVQA